MYNFGIKVGIVQMYMFLFLEVYYRSYFPFVVMGNNNIVSVLARSVEKTIH